MDNKKYLLRLYLVGGTAKAEQTVTEIERICKAELDHDYVLEVIDVLEKPSLAEDERIIATPTLVKVLPEPLRRVIGDLSNREQILLGLDLRESGGESVIDEG